MTLEDTRDEQGSNEDASDILARATRELKSQCDGRERGEREGRGSLESARSDSAATRARVMMSLRQREQRRTATIYVLVPAAAVLAASTAWAAASGRLPTVMKTLGEKFGFVESPSSPLPAAPAAQTGPRSGGPATSQGAPDDSEPSAPATEPAPAPEPAPAAEPARPAPRHPSPRATAAPPFDDQGDKLYEAAHRAHFGERNWAEALAAWDRYLAASPNGRFVPEARYNRAIALLRLDRRAEAVRELTPFADGKYGDYRQEEARSLIEALRK